MSTLAFPALKPALAPPEASGRSRADVALLVATRSDGTLRHARFPDLPRLLRPGDLLVVNTSATLAAALPARLGDEALCVHLSTPLARGRWVVELRARDLRPYGPAPYGARLALPGGGRVTPLHPYRGSLRLAEADVRLPGGARAYLGRYGRPIRYRAGGPSPPLEAYQTIFARHPGSAEMPSAGRPFTPEIVTALVRRGILVAPLTLHAGVSSLDLGETPHPERFRVPLATARVVAAVRGRGGRVVAVGTTVVRALEAAAEPDGTVRAATGRAEVVVTPERGLRSVDGLLTGWHEPASSHLLMLEAVGGRPLLERAYAAAAERGLVGHEFGDMHLILP